MTKRGLDFDALLADLVPNPRAPIVEERPVPLAESPELHSQCYNKDQLYQHLFAISELICACGGHCTLGPINTLTEAQNPVNEYNDFKRCIPLEF